MLRCLQVQGLERERSTLEAASSRATEVAGTAQARLQETEAAAQQLQRDRAQQQVACVVATESKHTRCTLLTLPWICQQLIARQSVSPVVSEALKGLLLCTSRSDGTQAPCTGCMQVLALLQP